MEDTLNLDRSDKDVELVEANASAIVKSTRRSRVSCTFNQMLGSLKVTNELNTSPLKSYQERLQNEIKEWKGLWVQTRNDIVNQAPPIVGVQSLNSSYRAYLEAAPSLPIFLGDSIKFRKHANYFLQSDYECAKESADLLLQMCHELVEDTKLHLINKRAAEEDY